MIIKHLIKKFLLNEGKIFERTRRDEKMGTVISIIVFVIVTVGFWSAAKGGVPMDTNY